MNKETEQRIDNLLTQAYLKYIIQNIEYTRAMAVLDNSASKREERQAANGILGRLT